MARARPKIPFELESLTRSELELIIDEHIKNEIDRQIAKMYYLDGVAQQDIGEEVGYSRSSIKRILPKLLNIICKYMNH